MPIAALLSPLLSLITPRTSCRDRSRAREKSLERAIAQTERDDESRVILNLMPLERPFDSRKGNAAADVFFFRSSLLSRLCRLPLDIKSSPSSLSHPISRNCVLCCDCSFRATRRSLSCYVSMQRTLRLEAPFGVRDAILSIEIEDGAASTTRSKVATRSPSLSFSLLSFSHVLPLPLLSLSLSNLLSIKKQRSTTTTS